jgi:hypothetical protein
MSIPENITDAELIERVAVEVMGFQVVSHDQFMLLKKGTRRAFLEDKIICNEDLPDKWNPLTDWNHTMEVMEEIKPRWMRFTEALEEISGTPVWEDILYEMDSRRICLAALKAISSPAQ